jgi:hypothetical protein
MPAISLLPRRSGAKSQRVGAPGSSTAKVGPRGPISGRTRAFTVGVTSPSGSARCQTLAGVIAHEPGDHGRPTPVTPVSHPAPEATAAVAGRSLDRFALSGERAPVRDGRGRWHRVARRRRARETHRYLGFARTGRGDPDLGGTTRRHHHSERDPGIVKARRSRLRPPDPGQHAILGDIDGDRHRRAATDMTAGAHDAREHRRHGDREIGEDVALHALSRGVRHNGAAQPRDALQLRSDFALLGRHHWLFINVTIGHQGDP